MYDLNRVKPHLREYVEQITQHSKGKFYICPLCGSGLRKDGAFLIYDETNSWTCFSCHKGGDIINLYEDINQCSRGEAIEALGRMYGAAEMRTGAGAPPPAPAPRISEASKPAAVTSYKESIDRWAAALPGSEGERYLQGRGFTAEIMHRFHLGTDGAYITIPYNRAGTYYGRRAIDDKRNRKHNNITRVNVPLYNDGALYKDDICFVVESPLCAISIEQCGLPAVALSGSTGGRRLLDQLQARRAQCTIMLCLDNDDAGKNATGPLADKLEAAGYTCIDATAAIMGGANEGEPDYYSDPNELLQADPDELKRRLQEAAEEARRLVNAAVATEAEERAVSSGPAAVDAFLEEIQTERYKPMRTMIRDIDAAIGGGLIRQQLVFLGAAPGAGKTALAQWIFETMAEAATADVLYLNLEMSRNQMLARSTSRVARQNGLKINALEVLQGYKWTRDQRSLCVAALDLYKRTIAPHMAYNPDGVTAELDSILSCMEGEARRFEAAGKFAPIVVIDYLQIIRGAPREDAVETIKRAVMAFKSYAVKHNTVVFVIMATNRDSNKTGVVKMESGRDTSAIEYSGDMSLGLSYTKCLKRPGEDPKSKDDLTHEDKAFKTLQITKGRFGGEDTEVDLYFDGETMTFTQISNLTAPTAPNVRRL